MWATIVGRAEVDDIEAWSNRLLRILRTSAATEADQRINIRRQNRSSIAIYLRDNSILASVRGWGWLISDVMRTVRAVNCSLRLQMSADSVCDRSDQTRSTGDEPSDCHRHRHREGADEYRVDRETLQR